ncbi:hypothetical protein Tco_0584131 [Tanacetum coccineum]
MDTLFKRVQRTRVRSLVSKILWKNLNGDAVEAFRARVAKGVSTQIKAISASDADSVLNILASIIKDATKDSLDVAIGTSKTHTACRETWWLCEEVQYKVAVKQARFRELLSCWEGNQEERFRMHERISQTEVRILLQKMGRNKAVGLDQIPIEAWRSLGDEGISWLTSLFNKIFTSAKMPEEWRLSDIIPIFKNKGDAQVCSNYRGIKLLSHTMKLWERVIERRLQRDTIVSENQSKRQTLENRREALEDNDLRVSREKTKYLRCDFGNVEITHNEEVDICIEEKILQPKELFRYLESMMHKSGRIDEYLKAKFYRVGIRPSMLYGSECWPITKALANRMEVVELRMLRWTCGKTMLDMIPNRVYRAELEVETIINKMRE